MTGINAIIEKIGIVPVIKLNNPERDAAPLAAAHIIYWDSATNTATLIK